MSGQLWSGEGAEGKRDSRLSGFQDGMDTQLGDKSSAIAVNRIKVVQPVDSHYTDSS